MNKVKQANFTKYGVEWTFQSENNKSKSKETWLNNYGCHVACACEIKEKISITMSTRNEEGLNGWDRIRKHR